MCKNTYYTPVNIVVYCLYIAIILVFVHNVSVELWDDPVIRGLAPSIEPSSFIHMYAQWSSRIFIQPVVFFLCTHTFVFKVAAAATLICMPVFLAVICSALRPADFWRIVCVCLLYPISDMRSAGWISTFANYMFPLAASLIFICCILRLWRGETLSVFTRTALVPVLFYATNHEQSLIITTGMLILFAYLIYKKHGRLDGYVCISLVVCGISGLVLALCPGNANRILFDTATFAPDFTAYGTVYKAYLGFITTAHRYFFAISLLSFVFLFLLALCLYEKYQEFKGRYIFFIPCVFPFFYILLTTFIEKNQYIIVPSVHSSSVFACLHLASAIMLCLLTLYYLYLLFDCTPYFFSIVYILCLGFASRMAVGFSPILFMSPTRISLFSDFSLIVGSLLLFSFARVHNTKLFSTILVACAVLQLVKNVLQP